MTNDTLSNIEFIETMFDQLPPGALPVGLGFPGDPSKRKRWGVTPITGESYPKFLTDPGLNNYTVVSSFTENEDGKYTRRKSSFAALHFVMIDDLGTGPGAKLPMDRLKLTPTALIETSPDNFQAFLKLDEPITDSELATRLIKAMIDQGLMAETDPGMAGITRVCRLPEGINGKPVYGGWDVKVAEWNPEVSYTVDEIVDAYALNLEAVATGVRENTSVVTDDPFYLVLRELGFVKRKPNRDGWVEITCPWVDEHTKAADNGAAYRLGGGFRCHHGHCEDRRFPDLIEVLRDHYDVDTATLSRELDRLRRREEMADMAEFEDWQPESVADNAVQRELYEPPGLVGEVARYIFSLMKRKQPLFAVAAALTTLALISSNKYKVEGSNTTLNLYQLLIGPTSSGKEGPRRGVKKIIGRLGMFDHLAETAASGAAVLKTLPEVRHRALLLMMDEIGRMLRHSATNSHAKELIDELVRLYGASNQIHAGKVYADKKQKIDPIEFPFVNLLGTTTGETLTEALSSGDVLSGFLNRILIVVTPDNAPPLDLFTNADDEGPPSAIVNQLKKLDAVRVQRIEPENEKFVAKVNAPAWVLITVGEDVRQLFTVFSAEVDQLAQTPEVGPLWHRAVENALRVAGVLAVGKDPTDPVITAVEAEWAIRWVRWCIESAVGLVRDHVADSREEHDTKRVLKILREFKKPMKREKNWHQFHERGWMPRGALSKRARIGMKRMDAALDTLLDEDQITLSMDKINHQDVELYRVAEHGQGGA